MDSESLFAIAQAIQFKKTTIFNIHTLPKVKHAEEILISGSQTELETHRKKRKLLS